MVTMVTMMIKCHIVRKSDTNSEWKLLVFLICILNVDSFNLKCPSQANWKFRAKVKCNSNLKYFCLYNDVDRKYVEGCDGPDWDRKGSKRIFAGFFTRGQCIQERFQPNKFWTNESMSDCRYAKSLCSEEGQIVDQDNSTKDDRTCRCDFKNSYSYIKTPRNLCSCIPTEEDCSCYVKTCPVNLTLSSDYVCIQSGYQGKPKCIDMIYSKTIDEKTGVVMEKNDTFISERTLKFNKWTEARAAMLFFVFCFIVVASGFTIALLFPKQKYAEKDRVTANEMVSVFTDEERNHESSASSSADREQNFEELNGAQKKIENKDHVDGKKHIAYGSTSDNGNSKETAKRVDVTLHQKTELYNSNLKDTAEQVDATVHQPTELFEVTRDEVNFLRIIHLLFRIACPVVRMVFDHEIQPKQLQKTLNKNKMELEKLYRKKDTIINDVQWGLLFGNKKGKRVTSEDFDIRLMIYLLRTIAKIEVGNLYPVPLDTSVSAMLSMIKYIRNEATQSIDGQLSENQFNEYWDDLGEATLSLVDSHVNHIDNDKERKPLIDRLLTLNPITIDKNKLSTFIFMSETYPVMILRDFISEYCTLNKMTIKQLLKEEKHQLYHKRHKTKKCCLCTNEQFSTYINVLSEKHWSALYDLIDCTNSHNCPLKLKICNERIAPKKAFEIDTCDVSVAMSLILYIPKLLEHFACRLCVDGFDNFLMNNQHTLYHSMKQMICCECSQEPIERTMISKDDWNKMFVKDDHSSCQKGYTNCCCEYSVKKGFKQTDFNEIIWSKVFYCAGPFSFINKIGQDAFLYFLSWSVDDQPLRSMLTELCKINTTTGNKTLSKRLEPGSSFNYSSLVETTTKKVDTQEWISKHLQENKSRVEPPLHMLLLDKGCYRVKSVQIPKDMISSDRIRKFKDITPEENNFLLVVHALKKVVHPVIKSQLKRRCSSDKLNRILIDIYYGKHDKDSGEVRNKDRKKKIYLPNKQQGQLFSPKTNTKCSSEKLDIKMMVYILTQRNDNDQCEGNTDFVAQLEDINHIRREIMQSSSGMLHIARFQEIMQSISKAVLLLGGEKYKEELSHLQNIKNILE